MRLTPFALKTVLILTLFTGGFYLWDHSFTLQRMFFGPPSASELDFNRDEASRNSRAIIVSPDEQINVNVFKKTHNAVVNIATTTLHYNFWMQAVPARGQGSGFIIDRRGYILTNNHVVEDAQRITVTLGSEKKLDAVLVGRDEENDIAVIRIPEADVPHIAKLGNSDLLKVGQKTIAIGNPFGLSQTMTTGIISALKRQFREKDGSVMQNLIQTDSAINPGNSGGPLLNSNGEVIGVNTMIYSLSGGSQGIGFAIPINTAKKVAEELITKGRYSKPWLGISGIDINSEIARELGLQTGAGVLIVSTAPGGPAELAGLHGSQREELIGNYIFPTGGDVIIAMNNVAVDSMETIANEVRKLIVGDSITLTIIRNGRTLKKKAILAETPHRTRR